MIRPVYSVFLASHPMTADHRSELNLWLFINFIYLRNDEAELKENKGLETIQVW